MIRSMLCLVALLTLSGCITQFDKEKADGLFANYTLSKLDYSRTYDGIMLLISQGKYDDALARVDGLREKRIRQENSFAAFCDYVKETQESAKQRYNASEVMGTLRDCEATMADFRQCLPLLDDTSLRAGIVFFKENSTAACQDFKAAWEQANTVCSAVYANYSDALGVFPRYPFVLC